VRIAIEPSPKPRAAHRGCVGALRVTLARALQYPLEVLLAFPKHVEAIARL
jgi:hypothetical protein